MSLFKGAVATLLGVFVVFLASTNITEQVKQIQQQRVASLVLAKRHETTAALKQEFTLVGTNEARMKNIFPSVENIPDFIAALESVATASSTQQTVKFGTPAPLPNQKLQLSTIEFDVALSGTVSTFLNYLKLFGELPYIAEITSLSISSAQSLSWEKTSTITFKARLYTSSLQRL